MTREWKPGDVAMVDGQVALVHADDDPVRPIFVYTDADGDPCSVYVSGATARPLAVIDPEDRVQVERLLVAQIGATAGCPDVVMVSEPQVSRMQAALRSLVAPPKPGEPTGLGAVIEDAGGETWVRLVAEDDGPSDDWARMGDLPSDGKWTFYADITAIRVLSEGVS